MIKLRIKQIKKLLMLEEARFYRQDFNLWVVEQANQEQEAQLLAQRDHNKMHNK
jgi:hypothetical protein